MFRVPLLMAVVSLTAVAHAQTVTPVFDVVSVKSNKSEVNSTRISWRDDAYSATNGTLKMFISAAYRVRQDLISGGPSWIDTAHFDLQAKVVDPDAAALKKMTPDERSTMLAAVLEDRFKLKTHFETRTLPVYELVYVKPGPKLTATNLQPGDKDAPRKGGFGPGSIMTSNESLKASSITPEGLANSLAAMTERTVIDKTGLKGRFDVELKFSPENLQMSAGGNVAGSDAPPLFEAIQEQLGLKLIPAKGPVKTLVIDQVEHPVED